VDWGAVFGAAAIIPWLNAGVRLAMPTAVAAAGETFGERAGVLNLGLEGMMIAGTLASFLAAYYLHNDWVGVLAGLLAGLLLAGIMGIFSIKLKTEQVVNGIAIVLFATAICSFIYAQIFGVTASPPRIRPLPTERLPLLGRIPGLGSVLFNQNVLVYLAVVLIALIWFVLFRTRLGLSVRAVGETPSAADTAGVNVDRTRWIALLVSGGMSGLGGAILVIAQLGFYADGITAGRGWIAIALVYFSRWNPVAALGGAMVFGVTDALQLRIQAAGGGYNTGVPFEVFQALPYLVTIFVMVLSARRARRDAQPAALGAPYLKEVSL
jgi:ABC-type uncharacterized transport system permease subunit